MSDDDLDVEDALAGFIEAQRAVGVARAALREAFLVSEPLDYDDLWFFYWFVPEVPVGFIADHLAAPVHLVATGMQPGPIGECPRCGGMRTPNARNAVGSKWGHWKCETCDENLRARAELWHDEAARSAQRRHDLATMPYRDYLRTPEWHDKRRAALRRARHRCQMCNTAAPLQVHHRTYERRGDELAADLIALCRGCHAKHHGVEP